MATTKKNIKVRDLKPSKDAKGGGGQTNSGGLNSGGLNSGSLNSGGLNSAGSNTSKANRHHRGGGHH
jgi:hypothetical protein